MKMYGANSSVLWWRYADCLYPGDLPLRCYIAGQATLIPLVSAEISIDPLLFRREPDNAYDELAIVIFDQKERKLGYVPRAKNEVPARLMDAGKLLFGQIEAKEWVGNWLKLVMRVYMRDI